MSEGERIFSADAFVSTLMAEGVFDEELIWQQKCSELCRSCELLENNTVLKSWCG